MVTTHEKQTFAPVSPELEQTHQFEKARRELYNIINDVEMQFEEKGVNPLAVKKGPYWLAVADHANRVVNEKYSTEETLAYGKLLQLTALAPAGFMARGELAALSHRPRGESNSADRERRQNLVGIASRNVDSLAMYARASPDLTAVELNNHLCETLHRTLEYTPAETLPRVSSLVRGVQHEVATGYLLMPRLEARISEQYEDLQGADYVVKLQGDKGVMLDVKTSARSIIEYGGNPKEGWAINRGRIVMMSQLDDDDLQGKFRPTERAIRVKAPVVESIVREASRKSQYIQEVDY